jgi:two-component system LytT family response regulator
VSAKLPLNGTLGTVTASVRIPAEFQKPMMPLTCLLVDDEPLARVYLRSLLKKEPGVRLLGEAASKNEALDLIGELRPQLLFLEIQMPGGGGFEILDELESPPAVVFVTAHDQHAIRAFDVNAMDYLMKPVDPLRLRSSVDRIRKASSGSLDASPVPLGNSGLAVAPGEIFFIEAEGHYSRVTLRDGQQHFIRQAFRAWSDQLPGAMFVQLDRGLIVNRTRISSFMHGVRAAEIRFDGMAASLALGSTAARRLKSLFGDS